MCKFIAFAFLISTASAAVSRRDVDADTENVLQELEDILTTGEEGEGSSQGGGPEGIYTSSSTSPSMSEEYMPGDSGHATGRATGWN